MDNTVVVNGAERNICFCDSCGRFGVPFLDRQRQPECRTCGATPRRLKESDVAGLELTLADAEQRLASAALLIVRLGRVLPLAHRLRAQAQQWLSQEWLLPGSGSEIR
jgi:hypothetical protein